MQPIEFIVVQLMQHFLINLLSQVNLFLSKMASSDHSLRNRNLQIQILTWQEGLMWYHSRAIGQNKMGILGLHPKFDKLSSL